MVKLSVKISTKHCEVNQPNVRNPNQIVWISDVVRNPNHSTTKRFATRPKSECSDFGRLLYLCKEEMQVIITRLLLCEEELKI